MRRFNLWDLKLPDILHRDSETTVYTFATLKHCIALGYIEILNDSCWGHRKCPLLLGRPDTTDIVSSSAGCLVNAPSNICRVRNVHTALNGILLPLWQSRAYKKTCWSFARQQANECIGWNNAKHIRAQSLKEAFWLVRLKAGFLHPKLSFQMTHFFSTNHPWYGWSIVKRPPSHLLYINNRILILHCLKDPANFLDLDYLVCLILLQYIIMDTWDATFAVIFPAIMPGNRLLYGFYAKIADISMILEAIR